MNQSGCPVGWATDQVVFYISPDFACDASVAVYIALGCTVCGLRLLAAVGHTTMWKERERKMRTRMRNNRRGENPRFPFIPVLSWLLVIDYTIFFALSGTNVGNPQNGLPAFFYGIGWLLFGIIALFYLLKFLRLGHRIAPRSKMMTVASSDGSDNRVVDGTNNGSTASSAPVMVVGVASNQINRDSLSYLDRASKVHFVLAMVALLGQTVCLCVTGMALPGNYRVIQAANGFQVWFLLQLLTGLIHHCERVKGAISTGIKANKKALLASTSSNDLSKVVTRLRHQQFVFFATAFPAMCVYCLVAAGVIPLRYYVIVIFMLLDCIATMGIVTINFIATRRKKKRRETRMLAVQQPPDGSAPLGDPSADHTVGTTSVGAGHTAVNRPITNLEQ